MYIRYQTFFNSHAKLEHIWFVNIPNEANTVKSPQGNILFPADTHFPL